ncbi:hypothetical protein [Pseudorhodoferax sp. Leaf267]|uniref:hypothetical protein n=1 Tax=Pseudorhodoferax sp. Leaf267 TaxID=1736316 RepID=UPI000715AF67|nr:hypothetical protein [Pseudorhodoferax sp. Leaf267]KQP22752.1 hypothetical protein ASF43_02290 [Pseudorhodoferax sp. Leaf267]
MLASARDQVMFGIDPATSAAKGQVQYLGNNLFRFLETGKGGSGTTLTVSSATNGYHVRTLDALDMGVTGSPSDYIDYVDFSASRTLEFAAAPNEVPEPDSSAADCLGAPVRRLNARPAPPAAPCRRSSAAPWPRSARRV